MRPSLSCINCGKKKKSCDKTRPCSRCLKDDQDCSYFTQNETSDKSIEFIIKFTGIQKIKVKHLRLEALFNKFQTLSQQNSPTNLYFGLNTQTNSNQSLTNDTLEGIEDLSNIIDNKRPNLISNPVTKGNLKCQDISLELVDFYFKFHDKLSFLSIKRDEENIKTSLSRDVLVLKYAICATSFNLFRLLRGEKVVGIQNNPYYLACKNILKDDFFQPTIRLVKAQLLCLLLELGNAETVKLSMTLAEVIRACHILNAHQSGFEEENLSEDPIRLELQTTWNFCISFDRLISIFFDQPTSIPFNDSIPFPSSDFSLQMNINPPFTKPVCIIQCLVAKSLAYFVNCHHKLNLLRAQYTKGSISSQAFLKNVSKLFEEIDGLKRYDWMDPEVIDSCLDLSDAVNHPFIVSLFSLNQSRLSLLTQIKVVQLRYTNTDTKEGHLRFLKFELEAKQLGVELFNRIYLIEQKLKPHFPKHYKAIYLSIHFSHLFDLEWCKYPFLNDESPSSKVFLDMCNSRTQEVAPFWPVFKDIESKKTWVDKVSSW